MVAFRAFIITSLALYTCANEDSEVNVDTKGLDLFSDLMNRGLPFRSEFTSAIDALYGELEAHGVSWDDTAAFDAHVPEGELGEEVDALQHDREEQQEQEEREEGENQHGGADTDAGFGSSSGGSRGSGAGRSKGSRWSSSAWMGSTRAVLERWGLLPPDGRNKEDAQALAALLHAAMQPPEATSLLSDAALYEARYGGSNGGQGSGGEGEGDEEGEEREEEEEREEGQKGDLHPQAHVLGQEQEEAAQQQHDTDLDDSRWQAQAEAGVGVDGAVLHADEPLPSTPTPTPTPTPGPATSEDALLRMSTHEGSLVDLMRQLRHSMRGMSQARYAADPLIRSLIYQDEEFQAHLDSLEGYMEAVHGGYAEVYREVYAANWARTIVSLVDGSTDTQPSPSPSHSAQAQTAAVQDIVARLQASAGTLFDLLALWRSLSPHWHVEDVVRHPLLQSLLAADVHREFEQYIQGLPQYQEAVAQGWEVPYRQAVTEIWVRDKVAAIDAVLAQPGAAHVMREGARALGFDTERGEDSAVSAFMHQLLVGSSHGGETPVAVGGTAQDSLTGSSTGVFAGADASPPPLPLPSRPPTPPRYHGPLAGAALVYLSTWRLFLDLDEGLQGDVVSSLPSLSVRTPVYKLGHDPNGGEMPTAEEVSRGCAWTDCDPVPTTPGVPSDPGHPKQEDGEEEGRAVKHPEPVNITVSFTTPGDALHALTVGVRLLHQELLMLYREQLSTQPALGAGQSTHDFASTLKRVLPVEAHGHGEDYSAPDSYTVGMLTPSGMALHATAYLDPLARAQAAAYQDGLFSAALLYLGRVGLQARSTGGVSAVQEWCEVHCQAAGPGNATPSMCTSTCPALADTRTFSVPGGLGEPRAQALFTSDEQAWSVITRLAQGGMQAAALLVGTKVMTGREKEEVLTRAAGSTAAPGSLSPLADIFAQSMQVEPGSSLADLRRGDPLAVPGVCQRALHFLLPLAQETASHSSLASRTPEDGLGANGHIKPLWEMWEDAGAAAEIAHQEVDLEFLRAEADAGNVEAAGQLGSVLTHGNPAAGVRQDAHGGAEHLHVAAAQGDVRAGVALAVLMLDTLPADHPLHNASRAMELLRAGEAAGIPDAYSGLGYVYQTGKLAGYPVNMSAAVHYLRLSAVQGDNPSSHSNLAAMYLTAPRVDDPGVVEGEGDEWGGVRYNGSLARWHLHEALRHGRPFSPARFNLGLVELHGMDPEHDYGEAGVDVWPQRQRVHVPMQGQEVQEGGPIFYEEKEVEQHHYAAQRWGCPRALPHFALVALQQGKWTIETPLSLSLAQASYRRGAGTLQAHSSAARRTLAALLASSIGSGSAGGAEEGGGEDALTPSLLTYLTLGVLGSGQAADNAAFLLESHSRTGAVDTGNSTVGTGAQQQQQEKGRSSWVDRILGAVSPLFLQPVPGLEGQGRGRPGRLSASPGTGLAWDTHGLLRDAAGIAEALFPAGSSLGGVQAVLGMGGQGQRHAQRVYECVQGAQDGYGNMLTGEPGNPVSLWHAVAACAPSGLLDLHSDSGRHARAMALYHSVLDRRAQAGARGGVEAQDEASGQKSAPVSSTSLRLRPSLLASMVNYGRSALGPLGPALGPDRVQLTPPNAHALYSLGKCMAEGWAGVPLCEAREAGIGGAGPTWRSLAALAEPAPISHADADGSGSGAFMGWSSQLTDADSVLHAGPSPAAQGEKAGLVGREAITRAARVNMSSSPLLRPSPFQQDGSYRSLRGWAASDTLASIAPGLVSHGSSALARAWALLSEAHERDSGHASHLLAMALGAGTRGRLGTLEMQARAGSEGIGLAWRLLDRTAESDVLASWAITLSKAQLALAWMRETLHTAVLGPAQGSRAGARAQVWDLLRGLWGCLSGGAASGRRKAAVPQPTLATSSPSAVPAPDAKGQGRTGPTNALWGEFKAFWTQDVWSYMAELGFGEGSGRGLEGEGDGDGLGSEPAGRGLEEEEQEEEDEELFQLGPFPLLPEHQRMCTLVTRTVVYSAVAMVLVGVLAWAAAYLAGIQAREETLRLNRDRHGHAHAH